MEPPAAAAAAAAAASASPAVVAAAHAEVAMMSTATAAAAMLLSESGQSLGRQVMASVAAAANTAKQLPSAVEKELRMRRTGGVTHTSQLDAEVSKTPADPDASAQCSHEPHGAAQHSQAESVADGKEHKCEEEVDAALLHTRTRRFSQLAPWQQDNQFITASYRYQLTVLGCIKSMAYWHNETLNIWSHFVGLLLFVFVFAPLCFLRWMPSMDTADYAVFAVFLSGCVVNMGSSTAMHLFHCHSRPAMQWLTRFDYSGISFMIVGSFYPHLHNGFRCHPNWEYFYMVAITLFGVVGVVVGCVPRFSTPQFRSFRALFFVMFGLFGVVPGVHLLQIIDFDFSYVLQLEVLMGALYIGGACIYASRWPESHYPGKCNLCGSHALWHLFVLAAAIVQLYSCVVVHHLRQANPCPV
jgi:adiponectin receptor